MKTKKKPVMLVTIVCAIGLGMIALNLTQFMRNPSGLVEIEAPNKQALEEVQKRQEAAAATRKPTQKELRQKSLVGNQMSTDSIVNGVPITPSILLPDLKSTPPKFESEATTAHWYDNESAQTAKADRKSTGN